MSATLQNLADELGVSIQSLKLLGVTRENNAWVYPERNDQAQPVGRNRRFDDGTKKSEHGSQRGLCYPVGESWTIDPYAGSTADDPILIVEGMSDTAAAMDAGLQVIGRSTATPGNNEMAWLTTLTEGRHVVVVGENDGGAGVTGAEKTSAALAKTCASVQIIYPPDGVKDLRSWIVDNNADAAKIQAVIRGDSSTPDDAEPLVLDPTDPLPTAEMFNTKYHTSDDGTHLLRHHQDEFLDYLDGHYRPFGDDVIRASLYKFTSMSPGFKPTQHKISIIIDALKAHINLPTTTSAPAWLNGRTDYPAKELLSHKTGILHLPTRTNLPPSPQFFTRSALDYSYDPQAKLPMNWHSFLQSLWPNDQDSINTLQEIFGYLLSEDTSQQKIFLIVGPKRSGKGTIARLLALLRGIANVAGPTLASLSTNFGLAPLIGKPVGIIADARLSARADQASITERLLSISGEDTLSIDRKYHPAWTGRLPTRFIVMTNETPKLNDVSGALAGRFIVLKMRETFFGREDRGMDKKLAAELPGILNWAIDGYQMLNNRGHFLQPSSADDAIEELEELGSPVGSFIRDRCVIEDGSSTPVKFIYEAWRHWCQEEGREYPGTLQSFSRDLRAAAPNITTVKKYHLGQHWREFQGIRLA